MDDDDDVEDEPDPEEAPTEEEEDEVNLIRPSCSESLLPAAWSSAERGIKRRRNGECGDAERADEPIGGGGALATDRDGDGDDEGEQPSPGFVMYLDSLGGTKLSAMELIRSYLSLEYNDKRSQAAARASPVEEPAPSAPAESSSRKRAREDADGGSSSGAGHGYSVSRDGGVGGCEHVGGDCNEDPGIIASQASASSDRVECTGENRPSTPSAHDDLMDEEEAAAGSGEGEGQTDYGSGTIGTSGLDQVAHLFQHYPVMQVTVPHQQNGVDCGLYMLKFIEKLSASMPSLVLGKRKRDEYRMRWDEVKELKFRLGDIAELRQQMADDIHSQSAKQQKEIQSKLAAASGTSDA